MRAEFAGFRRIALIVWLPVFLGLNRCAVNRLMMSGMAGFFEEGIAVVYQEGDLELARQFFGSNLEMIVIFQARDPQNLRLNLLAAQAFGAYAMAFVQDEDPIRADQLYRRGMNYAFKALRPQFRFDETILARDLERILASCTLRELPSLFWIGYNWGNHLLQHLDNPRQLINLAKVEMIMRRVLELDENYNFAGVHLFYGSYYAARPPLLGGKPEKGREHFERNIELTGGRLLLSKVMLAQYYAVQIQDRELFDSLLREVLVYDLDRDPDYRLMNAIAKQKAAGLLSQTEQFWIEDSDTE